MGGKLYNCQTQGVHGVFMSAFNILNVNTEYVLLDMAAFPQYSHILLYYLTSVNILCPYTHFPVSNFTHFTESTYRHHSRTGSSVRLCVTPVFSPRKYLALTSNSFTRRLLPELESYCRLTE